jgi:hypothetical protein
MAIDDVAPDKAQQRRVGAWAAVTDSKPMAVPDPAALMAGLEAIRARTLPGPESVRDLIDEGRRH